MAILGTSAARRGPVPQCRLAQIAERGDEPFVCDVVACEAWTGAHDDADRSLIGLLRFVEFVEAGPEQARRAGRCGRTLAGAGGRSALPMR